MIIDDDCIICIRIILLERKTPKQLLDLAQPCHIAAPAGLLRSADGPMSHQGMRWRWNLTCQRDAKRGNLGYSRAQARIQGSFHGRVFLINPSVCLLCSKDSETGAHVAFKLRT